MAIYGAGSNWSGEEVKDTFFADENYVIGWDRDTAADLHASLASLKIGDIIYLKSNQPGSRTLRVKGIGLVYKSFIECLHKGEYPNRDIDDWQTFFVRVKWLIQEEFIIEIPDDAGRLTNIRAATFYEEPLPFVQMKILDRLLVGMNGEPICGGEGAGL